MQQCRGRWRKDAGHTQTDQQEVETDDLAIIAMDALHECVAQAFECQQCIEITGTDRDISYFTRDGRTVADGDADICLGERWRIIHAIAA